MIGAGVLYPVLLVLRDSLVLDRWRWLARRLPRARPGERLLDVGCAAGAFALGAARRGYDVTGVDHDAGALNKARRRAAWLGLRAVRFEQADVRRLAERRDLAGAFDVVICCETVEHILDDAALVRALAGCLKPGGRLLLSAPYVGYRAISPDDDAPPSVVEDGGHVRRGYDAAGFTRLCAQAGLAVTEISGCSGWISQRITRIYRHAFRLGGGVAALAIMPLRPLPVLFDGLVTRWSGWPLFTLCLEARREGAAP